MRLIDGDALKDEMRAGCVPIGLGGITGVTGDDDSIEDYIDNAPTIDAIPVEWMRNEMNMADDRGDSEMTDAISWLLQTWQEERGV